MLPAEHLRQIKSQALGQGHLQGLGWSWTQLPSGVKTWVTQCFSLLNPHHLYLCHQSQVRENSPRSLYGLTIRWKDSQNHWKLLYSQLQFKTEQGQRLKAAKEKRHGEVSRRVQSIVTSGCLLPVELWTHLISHSFNVWRYAWASANQTSSPEPWCLRILLGLSHIAMADWSCGPTLVSRGQILAPHDPRTLLHPASIGYLKLAKGSQVKQIKARYSLGVSLPPRSQGQRPNLFGWRD